MIKLPVWKDLIEFTYIGNTSDEYNLKIKIIPPLAGLELANELKKTSHLYNSFS